MNHTPENSARFSCGFVFIDFMHFKVSALFTAWRTGSFNAASSEFQFAHWATGSVFALPRLLPLIVIRISRPGPAHRRTTLIHVDQLIHRGDHPVSDVAVVREGSSCVSAGAPRRRTDMKRDHGGASRPGPVARVRVPGPASWVLVLRGLQGRQSLLYRVSVGPWRPEPDSE